MTSPYQLIDINNQKSTQCKRFIYKRLAPVRSKRQIYLAEKKTKFICILFWKKKSLSPLLLCETTVIVIVDGYGVGIYL